MDLTEKRFENDTLLLRLNGRVDSTNAAQAEKELTEALNEHPGHRTVLDASGLEYISSAGLRVILKLKKAVKDFSVVNVNPDVYEIFEMTGFTEMMEIRKAYRKISVEGCEVIGKGANGQVYRIDPDTIVKVYLNPDSLEEIHKERELARTAFILGIPTAIPYDVVQIQGGGFGSVFELLNARSFAKLLISGEKTVEEIAEMSIGLLKQIHATEVRPETMPSIMESAMKWVTFDRDYLPQEAYEKLYGLFCSVPNPHRMLHGDFHLKNVMLQNGEILLIDMDTLCWGHPVFEISDMFNAYLGFSELDHGIIRDFLGIDHETAKELFDRSMEIYFDGWDAEKIRKTVDKARLISYTRILRRAIRKKGLDTEEGRREAENAKARILELLPGIDTLDF